MHSFITFRFDVFHLLRSSQLMRISVLHRQYDQLIRDFLPCGHPTPMSDLSIEPELILNSFLNLAKPKDINVKAAVIARLFLISDNLEIRESHHKLVTKIVERIHVFVLRVARVVVVEVALGASCDVESESS